MKIISPLLDAVAPLHSSEKAHASRLNSFRTLQQTGNRFSNIWV